MKQFVLMSIFTMMAFISVSAQDVNIYHCEELSVRPTFKEGDVASLKTYVWKYIIYPKKAWKKGVQGTVIVDFVIGADGRMRDYIIIESPNEHLSKAVIEMLEKMNKENSWTPGKVGTENVDVKIRLPVAFRICNK